jgi:fatty-acyl-CoA synthase
MVPVARDGETLGRSDDARQRGDEGLSENKASTDKRFAGGWFHTGDLGVMHPDGYIQLKDRSKDIIISGGENISSIEVEDTLYKHPAVAAAAVVAKPDDKWGETPCAFVELKPGTQGDHRRAGAVVPQAPRSHINARATWFREIPRPVPARSRNSSCARWRRGFEVLVIP